MGEQGASNYSGVGGSEGIPVTNTSSCTAPAPTLNYEEMASPGLLAALKKAGLR